MTRTAPADSSALEGAERPRPGFGQVWDRYGILVVLLAMVALMAVIAPNFLSLSNGFNVARAVSINAVLAEMATFRDQPLTRPLVPGCVSEMTLGCAQLPPAPGA